MKFDYAVQLYEKERIANEIARYERAQKEREDFLLRFPIDRVKSLSLDEYAFLSSADGNSHSFCTIMYSELEEIAHTGNAYTHMFGIYYKKDKELALSHTYHNIFGDDFDKAFEKIKSDIYELLDGVKNDNYAVVEKSQLHSSFRYKLLAVYFPEKFLPICTKTMMEPICKTMGVSFGDREMVYSNIDLGKMKESSLLTRDWNNGVFLGFCRWLDDNKSRILAYRKKELLETVNQVDDDLNSFQLYGEEREAVTKVRVNQGLFRDILLEKYPSCVLCKVSDKSLLIASHIKPWKNSEPDEKTDVDNGFILCPNHDRLFDKGFISFDDNGQIMISEELDEINRIFTNVKEGIKIELTEGNKRYLAFHRDNIFDKWGRRAGVRLDAN